MPTEHPEEHEPRLSWREKEVLAALRRLALAQSQMSLLDEQLAAGGAAPAYDPADLALVEELEDEIARARHKAHGRFGKSAARARRNELDDRQREVLARLGFADYDAFKAAGGSAARPAEAIDPVFVDFARRELADAEEAYRQALALPDDESPDFPRSAIDLTHPEAS